MSAEEQGQNLLCKLEEDLFLIYNKIMFLKIFVDTPDDEVKNKYAETITNHHCKIRNNMEHIDAGFDLLCPTPIPVANHTIGVYKLDYKVICSAQLIEQTFKGTQKSNTGYYMYPRSSISKSFMRLANNVGIIDSGYRGHLIGMFDIIYENIQDINKFDRHLQICAPGLIPILVQLVDTKEELGGETSRGDCGFGSTGK